MKSLRILLACAQAPLPEGSAAGRWGSVLLRGLTARGHRVTAFAACQSAAEAQAAGECFPAPAFDLRCYPAAPRKGSRRKLETLRRPHSYPFSPEMLHDWRVERLRGHHIVHLEETWSAWLEPSPGAPETILNIHNLYSIDWAHRRSDWKEGARRLLTVRTERKLIRSVPNLLALTPALAAAAARISPRARIAVVPLALDLDGYDFDPQATPAAEPMIAMIGSMNWESSRSAAERLLRRLWPKIKSSLPDLRLQITGRDARRVLREYLDWPGVEIRQDVASMKPYFEQATLLLYAPERGSGMKVKVLEAFAYGVPVVTTPAGVEGLDVEDGIHVGIHPADEGLVERTLVLLRDRVRWEKQRRAARRLMEMRYAPAPVMDRLEGAYAAVLARMDNPEAEVSEQYADRC